MISTREKQLGIELGIKVLFSAIFLCGISALYVYSWMLIY